MPWGRRPQRTVWAFRQSRSSDCISINKITALSMGDVALLGTLSPGSQPLYTGGTAQLGTISPETWIGPSTVPTFTTLTTETTSTRGVTRGGSAGVGGVAPKAPIPVWVFGGAPGNDADTGTQISTTLATSAAMTGSSPVTSGVGGVAPRIAALERLGQATTASKSTTCTTAVTEPGLNSRNMYSGGVALWETSSSDVIILTKATTTLSMTGISTCIPHCMSTGAARADWPLFGRGGVASQLALPESALTYSASDSVTSNLTTTKTTTVATTSTLTMSRSTPVLDV